MQAQLLSDMLYLRTSAEGATAVYVMAGPTVISRDFFNHLSISGGNTAKTSLS